MSNTFEKITIILLLLLLHEVRADIETTSVDNIVISNTTDSENTVQYLSELVPSLSDTTHASTSITVSHEPVSASNESSSSTEENEEQSIATSAVTETSDYETPTSTNTNTYTSSSSNLGTVRENSDDSNVTATTLVVETTSNTTSNIENSVSENFATTLKNDVNNTTSTLVTETAANVTLADDSSTSEDDYGTVIESDEDSNTTTIIGATVTEADNATVVVNGTETNTTKGGLRHQASVKNAISDIAYYLRAYKFNEYDRRYETNAEAAPRRYFREFPRPPLRSLHWEVRRYCESSFSECVDYLRKKILHVSLKRSDDTAVVMQEQNWTFVNYSEQITQVNQECQKLKKIGNIIAEPFEGPLERFQWRVTASYYMCWYTMQQVPELKHLSDHCDNFADCLDESIGPTNKDVRANDSQPYACALYSFCPDPCCPTKHLTQSDTCWNSKENPCFIGNPPGERECGINGSSNTEFRDIVLNRWNVTCRCPPGHEWNSRFGMCVDVDECAMGSHNCERKLQQGCVNLVGSFRCACVWGHVWSPEKKQCTESKALRLIKLSHKKDSGDSGQESQSLIRRLTNFFRRSSAEKSRSDGMVRIISLLCVSVFVLK